MSFNRYFRLSSYFLILCGFFSLVMTGFYSVYFFALFALVVAYSWNRERFRFELNLPKRIWNAATLAYFAYIVFEVFFRSGDLVGEAINFTVFLQFNKLLSRKENKDWFQMYILSFAHLVSASVLTESVSFAVPFLLYVVLATWALTLYNLKVQFEESLGKAPEAKEGFYESKTVITRKFLAVTSLLALIIIASTMVIFYSFPRMSLGYFYKRVANRKSMAGFSEQIDLGSIGSIMNNPSVVMRVETASPVAQEFLDNIYWRGTAFDRYDGQKWSHEVDEREKKLIDLTTGTIDLTDGKLGSHLFVQRIFLEPLDTRILFSADTVRVISWEKLKVERMIRREIGVERDLYETNYFFNDFASDQNYVAYSDLNAKTSFVPAESAPSYEQDITYLGLPYRDERTKALAERITSGARSDWEKAVAIEKYLKENYGYTMDSTGVDPAKPLESFLFDVRKGHCEYFSTAMTVLLRYAGVPSRNTVGFRGGILNDLGNYILVRQSDAHSWVEAYIWGNGWRRFDPTPASDDSLRLVSKRLGYFAKYFDYLKLRWNKYVIDYDLRTQSRYARLLLAGARNVYSAASSIEEDRIDMKQRFSCYAKAVKIPAYVIGAVIMAILIFSSRLKLRLPGKRRGAAIRKRIAVDFYSKMSKVLEKKGFVRGSSETPLEFGEKIAGEKGPRFEPVLPITRMYYDARFGGRNISEEELREIRKNIEELKRAVV